MKKYNKKGISLIVLVITIIVMIILAAAIILSISNSGIIDKATKAKQDSDIANLKEYANVVEAEWELMTEEERAGKTSTQYVNEKIKKKGYDAAYSVDGRFYAVANEVARDALSKGIKIGDVVNYEVTSKSEKSLQADTGYWSGDQTVANKTDFVWRCMGVSDAGELMIAPDVTSDSPKLTLYGSVGYLKGTTELHRLCNVLYTTSNGTARSMTIEDLIEILDYTGSNAGEYYDKNKNTIHTAQAQKVGDLEKILGTISNRITPESGKKIEDYYSNYYSMNRNEVKYTENIKYAIQSGLGTKEYYWLASTCIFAKFNEDLIDYRIRFVGKSGVGGGALYYSNGLNNYYSNRLRPVVLLTTKLQKSTDEDGNVIWNFVS